MQHLVGTLDHFGGHVALVRHAHVRHGVAADQAVLADEAEHAGEHLVAARSVMRVQQDDFVGLTSGADLAGVAQADHVLGEVAPVVPAHAGLAHHEGLEAFTAQLL
ncbi:hypothetical protein D3C84_778460 [compost metagenome]